MSGAPRALASFVVAASVAGCASSTCTDPSRAGFLDGLGNSASGCYTREEARLTGELQAAEARRSQLRAEASALEAESRALSQERKQLYLQVAGAQRELVALSTRLDTVRRVDRQQEAELNRLRAQEAAIARGLQAVGRQHPDSSDRQTIDRLETENRQLARQIDGFLKDLQKAT